MEEDKNKVYGLEWELGQIVGEDVATREMNEELSNGREDTHDEERPNGF